MVLAFILVVFPTSIPGTVKIMLGLSIPSESGYHMYCHFGSKNNHGLSYTGIFGYSTLSESDAGSTKIKNVFELSPQFSFNLGLPMGYSLFNFLEPGLTWIDSRQLDRNDEALNMSWRGLVVGYGLGVERSGFFLEIRRKIIPSFYTGDAPLSSWTFFALGWKIFS